MARGTAQGPITHVDPNSPKYKRTLRQDYAGLAMQGILTGYWSNDSLGGLDQSMIANEAVQQADALIAELEKGGDA